MEKMKRTLNSKVTIYNLCSPEIVKLSQELDEKIVEKQRNLYKKIKGVN